MKNTLILLLMLIVAACSPKEPAADEMAAPAEERAIGFNTNLPDLKWHLGTEDAIQVVKDIDKAWAAKDYTTLSTYLADTAKFNFADGRRANSGAEFVKILAADDENSDDSWTFDGAFSVDLDPSQGGEHVQAHFTGTAMKDGETTRTAYHESYYIIQGKLVMWNQYTQKLPPKEEE